MYEINVMVFLHRFILDGVRPIAEIVGMFSTDLRPEKKIGMIHGRRSVFFIIVQAQG